VGVAFDPVEGIERQTKTVDRVVGRPSPAGDGLLEEPIGGRPVEPSGRCRFAPHGVVSQGGAEELDRAPEDDP
jgi:hypothetical protein